MIHVMGQPNRFYHFSQTMRDILQRFDDRVGITTAGGINNHFRSLDTIFP